MEGRRVNVGCERCAPTPTEGRRAKRVVASRAPSCKRRGRRVSVSREACALLPAEGGRAKRVV
eukprot:4112012-Prymnesium_polylepis.1